jgi:hypothetical protein
MAQCKGEGAQNAPGWVGSGLFGVIAISSSQSKQDDIIKACLARNGYIQTAR